MASRSPISRRSSCSSRAISTRSTGMGVVFEQTGRPALAQEAFMRAHTIHPHHEAVSEALERVSRKLGGTDI